METKRTKKIVSFSLKKEAIEDLEKGFETEESILQRFDITPETLRHWELQVLRPTSGHRSRIRICDAVKRKAVREVADGVITIAEATIKYGCQHRNSIKGWIKKFSENIDDIGSITMANSELERQDQTEIQERFKELERALKQSRLKVASLETLIDIAEKELHIDIRKKHGTKQSS